MSISSQHILSPASTHMHTTHCCYFFSHSSLHHSYGDACMSRALKEVDPWAVILLSCLLLSIFGSYLALMRYLIMAIANRTYKCCMRWRCCNICIKCSVENRTKERYEKDDHTICVRFTNSNGKLITSHGLVHCVPWRFEINAREESLRR